MVSFLKNEFNDFNDLINIEYVRWDENWVMKRRIEEEKDDVEISLKDELIYLILRKMDLMTLMTSLSKMAEMAVIERMEAAWWLDMM